VVNKKTYRHSDDVYVGRGSPLGNPFGHKPSAIAKFKVETRAEAIEKYREWLVDAIESDPVVSQAFTNLVDFYKDFGGLVLSCWCSPKRCHAEVIAEMIEDACKKLEKPPGEGQAVEA
jgi:hypothetical protein